MKKFLLVAALGVAGVMNALVKPDPSLKTLKSRIGLVQQQSDVKPERLCGVAVTFYTPSGYSLSTKPSLQMLRIFLDVENINKPLSEC